MKTIAEILALGTIQEIINILKEKTIEVPDWEELYKEFEPSKHRINDPSEFPDKKLKNEKGEATGETSFRTRVMLGLEQLVTKRMAEFMFTTPPKITCEEITEESETVIKDQFASFQKILKRTKWPTMIKERCKIISSQCEQATLWYVVDTKKKHKMYGFETTFKLKCRIFYPEKGDNLFPLFSETGDMIAMSREFKIKETSYFETWTDEKHIRYTQSGSGGWTEEILKDPLPIGKIALIYAYRPKPIWRDGDHGKRDEMERMLSRNGDIIAYHASPILALSGEIKNGGPKKDESNKVIQMMSGAKAEYISWTQSPEATKFQFEQLWKTFFAEIQLPDLSFENIKGMGGGGDSGEARKFLFADAHLKCGDEAPLYEDLFDREFSVIKAFMGKMNPSWDKTINELEIDRKIIPFIIEDEKAKIDVLVSANGQKPVLSQKMAVQLAGYSDDPNAEFAQIESEAKAAAAAESRVGGFL